MHRVSVIAALLSLMAPVLNAAAQQSPQGKAPEDPAWYKRFLPKRIVYQVPGMEQVKVTKNVTYKRVGETELSMDVYAPPDLPKGKRLPAVIFIHGGPLPPNLRTPVKDAGVYVSYGQLLAASGFIGVTFTHRYFGWNSLPDSQSDVADLIAYVRANADALQIDKERLCLWAFSGGGLFLGPAIREAPPHIRCLVSYYGLLDARHLRREIPAAVTEDTLREASPLYQLEQRGKGVPPLFVARAGRDSPDLI